MFFLCSVIRKGNILFYVLSYFAFLYSDYFIFLHTMKNSLLFKRISMLKKKSWRITFSGTKRFASIFVGGNIILKTFCIFYVKHDAKQKMNFPKSLQQDLHIARFHILENCVVSLDICTLLWHEFSMENISIYSIITWQKSFHQQTCIQCSKHKQSPNKTILVKLCPVYFLNTVIQLTRRFCKLQNLNQEPRSNEAVSHPIQESKYDSSY